MQAQSAPPKFDSDTLPRTVKVDLDTPLESVWTFLALGSAFACIVILQITYFGTEDSPPDPSFIRFFPYAAGAILLFTYLRTQTDNYYIVDRQRKTIFYHFGFAFIRRVREYLGFSDVDAVVVSGFICASDGSNWYQYQLLLVDKAGITHPFSDQIREDELTLLNTRAKTISSIIECRFFPGRSEHIQTATVDRDGRVVISSVHTPLGATDSGSEWKKTLLILSACFLVGILVVFILNTLFD